ncbi:hypothetical protein OHA01_11300 [Micromonospora zamorensis]|nr:hypothetical protein OHA01_11300 [Micromonospora zamorensis]
MTSVDSRLRAGLRSRVHAELVREPVAPLVEDLQHLRLPSVVAQRRHQLGDELAVPAEQEIGLHPVLHRGGPQLL